MKLSVKKRLYLGFGFFSLIILVLGLYSVIQFTTVEQRSDQVSDVWLEGIDKIRAIEISVSDLRIQELVHIVAEPEVKQQMVEEIQASKQQIEESLRAYQGLLTTDKDRQLYRELQTAWQKYDSINNAIITQNVTLEKNNDLIEQSIQAYTDTDTKIHAILDYHHTSATQEKETLKKIFNYTKNLLLGMAFLAVILSLVAAYTLNRSIVQPLQAIEAKAKQLAAGASLAQRLP